LPTSLTDGALEALPFAPAGGSHPGARRKDEPDWTAIHRELRRPGVTLQLLWEEYRVVHAAGYGYSRWCEPYRIWEGRLSPTMSQVHPAGERLFVDYAGHTVEVVDGSTGELHAAQVFVAVLGASNCTYAEASWTQSLPDWISSQDRGPHHRAHRRVIPQG
jgi:transposase